MRGSTERCGYVQIKGIALQAWKCRCRLTLHPLPRTNWTQKNLKRTLGAGREESASAGSAWAPALLLKFHKIAAGVWRYAQVQRVRRYERGAAKLIGTTLKPRLEAFEAGEAFPNKAAQTPEATIPLHRHRRPCAERWSSWAQFRPTNSAAADRAAEEGAGPYCNEASLTPICKRLPSRTDGYRKFVQQWSDQAEKKKQLRKYSNKNATLNASVFI